MCGINVVGGGGGGGDNRFQLRSARLDVSILEAQLMAQCLELQ